MSTDETPTRRPHFTVTITEDDGDWGITRDIAGTPADLCEMATHAATEVQRIHDQHHTNLMRIN